MIGGPASRGAVASVGGAARVCFAAASAVSAVSAAIAANVTMAGDRQRRIGTVDCAVVNRLTILSPVEMHLRARLDQVSNRNIGPTTAAIIHTNFAPREQFRRQIPHIRQAA
jgi:hypothetical protein